MHENMLGVSLKRCDDPAQSYDFRAGTDNGHDFHRGILLLFQTVIQKASITFLHSRKYDQVLVEKDLQSIEHLLL